MIAATDDSRRLPGEEAVWIFILLDMLSFALFFAAFSWSRAMEPVLFAQSQRALHPELGLLNTILLIGASWLVAAAVGEVRAGRGRRGAFCLTAAALLGLGFGAIKAVEYTLLGNDGWSIASNTFFMYYFCLTIIHLLHAAIGVGVLSVLAMRTRQGCYAKGQTGLESGASFWHMVDLIWIFLFPLLYLLR